MSKKVFGMKMNDVVRMVGALVNTDEHPLYCTLGQDGPYQEQHHQRDKGSFFHSMILPIAVHVVGIALDPAHPGPGQLPALSA
jgi:hypothetical protein